MKHSNFKIIASLILFLNVNLILAQNPNWQPPIVGNFANTSSVIAQIKLSDIVSNNSEDQVAFFVGNELRGLGKSVNIGNGTYIHFITVYSNAAVESMKIKVFHKSSNQVYEVATPFGFKNQSITGSVNTPFVVKIYPDDNSPLSILNVPPQTTIRTVPFVQIDMADFLIQPDAYPVDWSIVPNANLIAYFTGSILHVMGANDFEGQATLIVRATEISMVSQELLHHENNRNQSTSQIAETSIVFNVSPLLNQPRWEPKIPNQGIVKGNQFVTEHLDNYENQYNGPSILYDYKPIISSSNPALPRPAWATTAFYSNNMTVIARLDFTPKYQFHHPNDVLGAFVDNELRGVAVLDSVSGLYFLTIKGGTQSGSTIDLQFYSGAMKQILYKKNVLSYAPYKIQGSADVPYKIDFAPIVPLVPNTPVSGGIAMMPIEIIDTAFIGSVTFEFQAKDPDYPTYFHDETLATYCIVENEEDLLTLYQDADGDGLGNPNVSIQTCIGAAGYVTNADDCSDNNGSDPPINVLAIENSGSLPNDGSVCSGATVTLFASGGLSYVWENGVSNASNIVMPLVSTTYRLTVTFEEGCKDARTTSISVEGTIVKNIYNEGEGSLRNVFSCITEGGTITYELPLFNTTTLTAPLIIDKNVAIQGLPNLRPVINVDFNNTLVGINVLGGKKLTLTNIDLTTINAGSKKLFTGNGSIEVTSTTHVKKL